MITNEEIEQDMIDEQNREYQGTQFDDWFSDRKEELEAEFKANIEDDYDDFMEFCKSVYRNECDRYI